MKAMTFPVRASARLDGTLTTPALMLPSVVSLLALMFVWGLDEQDASRTPLWLLLGAQAWALAAVSSALASHMAQRVAVWQRRLAPSRAERRMRVTLWRWLARTAALGLGGPVVLAGLLAARQGGLVEVPGALLASAVILLGAQLVGALAGLACMGRAPRAVLLAWPALALATAVVPDVWLWLAARPVPALSALAVIMACAWHALGRAGSMRLRATPWPDLSAWLRRPRVPRWQRVPMDNEMVFMLAAEDDGKPARQRRRFATIFPLMVVLPQVVIQHKHWWYHGWGQVLSEGYGPLLFAAWIGVLALLAQTMLVGPSLHWRRRLAPGGLDAKAWARRMLMMSAGLMSAWLGLIVVLIWAVSPAALRPAQVATLVPVLADGLLVIAGVAWWRGRRNSLWFGVLGALWLGLLALIAVRSLHHVGVAVERGWAMLVGELLVAALLARSALRHWARQDLNRLL